MVAKAFFDPVDELKIVFYAREIRTGPYKELKGLRPRSITSADAALRLQRQEHGHRWEFTWAVD